MSAPKATQDFSVNKEFSSLWLLGGRDCKPGTLLKQQSPDLWVKGGSIVEKTLCVLGNLTVDGLMTGNVCGQLFTDQIVAKVLQDGIDVFGDLIIDPDFDLVSTIRTNCISDFAGTGMEPIMFKSDIDLRCNNVGNVSSMVCKDLSVTGNILNDRLDMQLSALDSRLTAIETDVSNNQTNINFIIAELAMMANATVSVVAQQRSQPADNTYSQFLVERIDTHNAFDGTFFTAPMDAKYFFAFYAFGTFPPTFVQYVQIRKNNVSTPPAYAHFTQVGGTSWGVSGTVDMVAGDQLGVFGAQRYSWGVVQDSGISIFSIDL
jgi:hypothetical protein